MATIRAAATLGEKGEWMLPNHGWILTGRVAFAGILAGLIVYLVSVGLDKADKVASSVGVVVALLALGVPHLLRAPGKVEDAVNSVDLVEGSGSAVASDGGSANSGVAGASGDRPAQVIRSGNAQSEGQRSAANTGIQRNPHK